MNISMSNENSYATGREIETERVRVLYKQAPSVLIGNVLIASLLGIGLYAMTGQALPLYWVLFIFILTALRYILVKEFHQKERDEKNILRWGWYFALTTFASGITWGSTSLLFVDVDNLTVMMFLLMTLTGITVGSSAALSNFVWSYYLFSVSVITPYAYILAREGSYIFILMSLMLLVFLVLQLVIARRNQDTLDESIVLRNENVELMKELQVKKAKAEKASSSKTRFLAAASHDLRQPVHAASLFLDILSETTRSKKQIAIIDKIRKSFCSLEEILESLLDISKFDAGVVQVNKQNFSVQSLFDALENEFYNFALEKGLGIRFVKTSVWVDCDRRLVDSILRNIISNAVRYTYSGRILVGCRHKGKNVVIEVYDTGVGIDKEYQEIIYEEFFQIDDPSRDRSKGLGLGLSIVRRIVDLLGIELRMISEPGRGSCFSLELPLSSLRNEVQSEANDVTYNMLYGNSVIVIDDENDIRHGLNELLKIWGCKVCQFSSITDICSEKLPETRPDIILTDYRLQNNQTGIDAIKMICNIYHDASIPAIIITGDTAPERIKEAQDSGYHLLHKPVSGGKIRALLTAVLFNK